MLTEMTTLTGRLFLGTNRCLSSFRSSYAKEEQKRNSVFGKNDDLFLDYLDEKDRLRKLGIKPNFTIDQFKKRYEKTIFK